VKCWGFSGVVSGGDERDALGAGVWQVRRTESCGPPTFLTLRVSTFREALRKQIEPRKTDRRCGWSLGNEIHEIITA